MAAIPTYDLLVGGHERAHDDPIRRQVAHERLRGAGRGNDELGHADGGVSIDQTRALLPRLLAPLSVTPGAC